MTMGTYIKQLKEEMGISQEELGKSLNPPVNKWETGQVENIKRTHIQQLAKKFGVSPCELMCFDDRFDSAKAAEETKAIELVQKHFWKRCSSCVADVYGTESDWTAESHGRLVRHDRTVQVH